MDQTLLELLRKYNEQDASEHTHITLYGPSSRWCIPDANQSDFWISYCGLVYDKTNAVKPKTLSETKSPNYNLCLAEVPKKHMPIVVDFTLKFHPLENSCETYEYDFILSTIYCVQQAMLRVLQISESAFELICCVLDSDEYMEDNKIISRFRLHFPYCRTEVSTQVNLLKPLIIKLLRTENAFSMLTHQPIDDWNAILSMSNVDKSCMMYGSSRNKKETLLKLHKIYTRIDQDDIYKNNLQDLDLKDIFKPTNHMHIQNSIVQASIFANDKPLTYWLPMFFSSSYWNKVVISKSSPPELSRMSKYTTNDMYMKSGSGTLSNSNSTYMTNSDTDNDLNNAENFLMMLSRDRIEKENYWLDIGKSLYGTFKGDEKGLELWIKLTERSETFDVEECKDLYPTFNKTPYTIKTLAWYAREDSPDEYEKWHRSWYAPALEEATSRLDADVVEAVYRVYWLDFVCSSISGKVMYHFRNHIWKRLDNGHTLKDYITGDFINKYEEFRTVISIKIQDSYDKRYKDSAELLVKKISNLINKLKSERFSNTIFTGCLRKFYVEDFNEILDATPNIMGMVNGVLEAGSKEAVLRPGKPEDYISKSTGLIWRYDLHWKHPTVVKLMEWLRKVYPDKELLDYFGKISASCLRGRNPDKLFPIMTGKGDNSKSMIKKLFECTFGSYCITFPTALFTSKRSTGPDPSVARSKYAHIAFAQEPDADDPLKNGVIKEMSGGDKFFARYLHDNGGEIEPMFTLILMCNTVPQIPHSDKAMKNRVRLIPHLSTWVSNPPGSIDERYKKRLFKKDKFFKEKIPALASAFMWYMIQMYKRYITEGLNEPKLVTESTKEYWNENDVYLQFIRENIIAAYKEVANWPKGKEKPRDEDSKITVAQMYSRFRDWHRECFNGIKCPDRPIVKGELENRMGKAFQRAWRGIKFKVELAMI